MSVPRKIDESSFRPAIIEFNVAKEAGKDEGKVWVGTVEHVLCDVLRAAAPISEQQGLRYGYTSEAAACHSCSAAISAFSRR